MRLKLQTRKNSPFKFHFCSPRLSGRRLHNGYTSRRPCSLLTYTMDHQEAEYFCCKSSHTNYRLYCCRYVLITSRTRQRRPIWKWSTINSNVKLVRLYSSIVVPTGIYASETWKTNRRITKMIDVFHRRCLRSILGISCRDHITNDEVMARSGQFALHDIVATRRRRFVGHIPHSATSGNQTS